MAGQKQRDGMGEAVGRASCGRPPCRLLVECAIAAREGGKVGVQQVEALGGATSYVELHVEQCSAWMKGGATRRWLAAGLTGGWVPWGRTWQGGRRRMG